MLDKLKSKLNSTRAALKPPPTPEIKPDIGRVIKPSKPTSSSAPAPTAPPKNYVPAPSTTLEMESRAAAAVDDLSDQFQTWMKTDLDKLMAGWITASAPDAGPDAHRQLYMAAHDIHGAAVSYGFPAVSRLCGSLCRLLSSTKPGENAGLINLHIEACRAAVKAKNPGIESENMADAVCSALEEKVAYYEAAEAAS